jgi:hypothetical protein
MEQYSQDIDNLRNDSSDNIKFFLDKLELNKVLINLRQINNKI